jgi:hypothetical protein
MALVYLVNKPKGLGRVARWLLLILEYDFIVVYKLDKTHVITDVFSKLLNIIEPIGVLDQTIDASLFYTKPDWLNDVKDFLRTRQIERTLFIQQKWRHVKKVKSFALKNGELYIMGQSNKL